MTPFRSTIVVLSLILFLCAPAFSEPEYFRSQASHLPQEDYYRFYGYYTRPATDVTLVDLSSGPEARVTCGALDFETYYQGVFRQLSDLSWLEGVTESAVYGALYTLLSYQMPTVMQALEDLQVASDLVAQFQMAQCRSIQDAAREFATEQEGRDNRKRLETVMAGPFADSLKRGLDRIRDRREIRLIDAASERIGLSEERRRQLKEILGDIVISYDGTSTLGHDLQESIDNTYQRNVELFSAKIEAMLEAGRTGEVYPGYPPLDERTVERLLYLPPEERGKAVTLLSQYYALAKLQDQLEEITDDLAKLAAGERTVGEGKPYAQRLEAERRDVADSIEHLKDKVETSATISSTLADISRVTTERKAVNLNRSWDSFKAQGGQPLWNATSYVFESGVPPE